MSQRPQIIGQGLGGVIIPGEGSGANLQHRHKPIPPNAVLLYRLGWVVTGDLESIKEELRDFARERCWEKFHSPKNLSMALIVEVAELVEHFQWLSEENSYVRDGLKVKEISYELSDILMYLIRLADILEIDLVAAYREKIEINRAKYPPKAGIED